DHRGHREEEDTENCLNEPQRTQRKRRGRACSSVFSVFSVLSVVTVFLSFKRKSPNRRAGAAGGSVTNHLGSLPLELSSRTEQIREVSAPCPAVSAFKQWTWSRVEASAIAAAPRQAMIRSVLGRTFTWKRRPRASSSPSATNASSRLVSIVASVA